MEEQKKQAPAKAASKDKPIDYAKLYHRKECDDLLRRKFFYNQAFEIYGGVAGFYDLGPLGSAVKVNVESLWRQHFIMEDDMLELTCTNMTLGEVLKTSGHVDKFADFMVKDTKNGQCHRADKLIDDWVTKTLTKKKNLKPEEKEKFLRLQADCENYSTAELDTAITEHKIKAPDTGNDLGPATPFNLMFECQIGPTGYVKGYLRPETAQGIFLNFRRLIEFNNGRMPCAGAQLGLGFRNEIHPRQGLLRVREFQMAEIEHFVDPLDKSHHKFFLVKDDVLPLWTAPNQEALGPVIHDLTLGDAVAQGTVGNETVAYFMARSFKFLVQCGIKPSAIRYRQHRSNEMAHYAADCWDAEVETSYGWIEVAGHADRSCFDLTKHAEKTKVELSAARPLKEPKKVHFIKVVLDKAVVGKTYKKDSKNVLALVDSWTNEDHERLITEMEANNEITIKIGDNDLKLSNEVIKFTREEKTVLEEKYVPHVIEPSFGIGRIIYCIFEHAFKMRDATRHYFDFPVSLAPVKCSLLPLMSQPALNEKIYKMKTLLTAAGLSSKIDDSGQTVGRRYARTDECGIPFAFTVDFDTLENETVTMRELDTMKQIRLPMAEAPRVLDDLVHSRTKWSEVLEKYPNVEAKAEEEKK